jgi:hypothetical protein
MNEVSYAAALEAGIEPIQYRSDHLTELGPGQHPGVLDALVWSKRKPCLMALIQLDTGVKVQMVGFQKHSRPELPDYLGLRELTPGQRVELVVDIGLRGGLRPTLRGEH